VATIRCSRTVPASPAEVWAIIGDPYHMPRWWPRVLRVEGVEGVEGVEEDGFTQVGAFMVSRATERQLDEALSGLQELLAR